MLEKPHKPQPGYGAFLGRGWAFPVSTQAGLGMEAGGEIAMAEYEDDIRQSIRIILETDQGERVMRPDFGAGLPALAFEPLNTTTLALARHRVEGALIAWEPRIDHISVQVETQDFASLQITIQYRVRATNTFYNLVYPFYLQEGG